MNEGSRHVLHHTVVWVRQNLYYTGLPPVLPGADLVDLVAENCGNYRAADCNDYYLNSSILANGFAAVAELAGHYFVGQGNWLGNDLVYHKYNTGVDRLWSFGEVFHHAVLDYVLQVLVCGHQSVDFATQSFPTTVPLVPQFRFFHHVSLPAQRQRVGYYWLVEHTLLSVRWTAFLTD